MTIDDEQAIRTWNAVRRVWRADDPHPETHEPYIFGELEDIQSSMIKWIKTVDWKHKRMQFEKYTWKELKGWL